MSVASGATGYVPPTVQAHYVTLPYQNDDEDGFLVTWPPGFVAGVIMTRQRWAFLWDAQWQVVLDGKGSGIGILSITSLHFPYALDTIHLKSNVWGTLQAAAT